MGNYEQRQRGRFDNFIFRYGGHAVRSIYLASIEEDNARCVDVEQKNNSFILPGLIVQVSCFVDRLIDFCHCAPQQGYFGHSIVGQVVY